VHLFIKRSILVHKTNIRLKNTLIVQDDKLVSKMAWIVLIKFKRTY
jgi:hypothetical protein